MQFLFQQKLPVTRRVPVAGKLNSPCVLIRHTAGHGETKVTIPIDQPKHSSVKLDVAPFAGVLVVADIMDRNCIPVYHASGNGETQPIAHVDELVEVVSHGRDRPQARWIPIADVLHDLRVPFSNSSGRTEAEPAVDVHNLYRALRRDGFDGELSMGLGRMALGGRDSAGVICEVCTGSGAGGEDRCLETSTPAKTARQELPPRLPK